MIIEENSPQKDYFLDFLDKLASITNAKIIESIREGYLICKEFEFDTDVGHTLNTFLYRDIPESTDLNEN